MILTSLHEPYSDVSQSPICWIANLVAKQCTAARGDPIKRQEGTPSPSPVCNMLIAPHPRARCQEYGRLRQLRRLNGGSWVHLDDLDGSGQLSDMVARANDPRPKALGCEICAHVAEHHNLLVDTSERHGLPTEGLTDYGSRAEGLLNAGRSSMRS